MEARIKNLESKSRAKLNEHFVVVDFDQSEEDALKTYEARNNVKIKKTESVIWVFMKCVDPTPDRGLYV